MIAWKFARGIVAVGLLASSAIGAAAQTSLFSGSAAAKQRVRELETAIRNDAARDIPVFGSNGLSEGWSGSLSARFKASSGNSDMVEAGLGLRLNYFDGSSGHRVRLSYDYSATDGESTGETLRAGYEYTRDFGSGYYAFGELRAVTDEFASLHEDYFAGGGGGYRLRATRNSFWAVQAGPGYRLTRNAEGERDVTVGYTLSSYFSQRLSETMVLSNDTSLIGAEGDAAVLNDLALKIRLRERLSLRAGLLTEYQSDPLPGYDHTDNTLRVSVVYSFD